MARAGRVSAQTTALAFVLALACALPASAQTGSGLYEPFPEPAARSQAQDYLEEILLRPVSVQELDDGRFIGALTAARPTARPASERAGMAGARVTLLDLPAAILLAAIVLAVAAMRRGGSGLVAP